MTKQTQMEFQTKELEENVKQGEKSLIEKKKDIEVLTKKIAKVQTELDDEIEPNFQEAKDAVSLELAALRDRKTWAEDKVMERSDARRLYPDAHFAGLFAILGIKNHESSDKHV